MLIVQMTGLSGAGKSTIAYAAKRLLAEKGHKVEVIDGDEFRKHLCKDLGFSRCDRNENIRRLGFIGNLLSRNGVIAIIAAINPYEAIREEIKNSYDNVLTVWIDCDLDILAQRDVKGIYKRALYPEGHPEKISKLTGISDPYEAPDQPDLTIHTGAESQEESISKFVEFIAKWL